MKIVITGGTGGIGRILVDELSKQHKIVLLSRTKKTLEESAKKNSGIETFAADVSDAGQIQETFKKIGQIDALINCAGILGPVGSFETNDAKLWEETIKVNLFGTVNCCRAAIPFLRKDRPAKIINFSGGGSAFPRLYHTAYATSKAAVVRFTENLAKDLEKDGRNVDVNAIAPGAHKTNIWKDETFDKEPDKWGDPQALIRLVRFLLSEKSDGVTGKFLHINDDYEKLDKNISGSDLFTLRRIDDLKFKEVR